MSSSMMSASSFNFRSLELNSICWARGKGIDIAVGDIAVYRVTHTLGYIVMRDTGVSKVCCKGVSAPGTAWMDFPAHTVDKTADTFLDVLVFHSNALPPVYRSHSITINSGNTKDPLIGGAAI